MVRVGSWRGLVRSVSDPAVELTTAAIVVGDCFPGVGVSPAMSTICCWQLEAVGSTIAAHIF